METTEILVRNIPVDLWRKIKVQAATEGRTIQQVVAAALQSYLKRAA